MFVTRSVPRTYQDYQRYRPQTQADFRHSCAYCFIHEDIAGGERAFAQDHFRPSARYPHLKAAFKNLYWSCTACNGTKGDRFPSDEEFSRGVRHCDPCEQDPCATDYRLRPDGRLEPLTEAGRYTVERLRLNRPTLIRLRSRWLAARRVLVEAEGFHRTRREVAGRMTREQEALVRSALDFPSDIDDVVRSAGKMFTTG